MPMTRDIESSRPHGPAHRWTIGLLLGLTLSSMAFAQGQDGGEVPPTVDINPCSVFSQGDLEELGLVFASRSARVVGFAADEWRLVPSCRFRRGHQDVDIEVDRADAYRPGKDAVDVGEAGHFSTRGSGNKKLVFVSQGREYTIGIPGKADPAGYRTTLLDYAARVLDNEAAQDGLFDGLSTAERVGGPAVYPCDLVDAGQLAAHAGLAHYMVYPKEGGRLNEVSCVVSGGLFNTEELSFFATRPPCGGETVEVEGRDACMAEQMTGVGLQLEIDMGGYWLVLVTSRDAEDDVNEPHMRALARAVIAQW